MDLNINVAISYTPSTFATAAGIAPSDWEFSTSQSTVPAGLTLTTTLLSGTPTAVGTGTIVLSRWDDYGAPVTQATAINVVDPNAVPEPEPEPPVEEPDPEPVPDTPGKRIADFLGQGDNPDVVELAGEHVTIITAMARAYTRGGGFTDGAPNEEVDAVITTATARLVANPEQIDYSIGGTRIGRGFQGWSLGETAVLNRYRRRAL